MGEFITSQHDTNLRALAHELKHPLVNIARRAELADAEAVLAIRRTAEQALMLIDCYLLTAQTNHGQLALELSPATVGSILYDASVQMRPHLDNHNASILLDDRTHEPVMTHRPALLSIINVFGNTLMDARENDGHQDIVLRGYRTRSGNLGIGVFSEDAQLSQGQLRRALDLQGRAHMPLASASASAHVSLAIADSLCRAIGGAMQVKRMGRFSGLATELPRSEQMAFV
jgi:K+-sensing histidine kinase KdpD